MNALLQSDTDLQSNTELKIKSVSTSHLLTQGKDARNKRNSTRSASKLLTPTFQPSIHQQTNSKEPRRGESTKTGSKLIDLNTLSGFVLKSNTELQSSAQNLKRSTTAGSQMIDPTTLKSLIGLNTELQNSIANLNKSKSETDQATVSTTLLLPQAAKKSSSVG